MSSPNVDYDTESSQTPSESEYASDYNDQSDDYKETSATPSGSGRIGPKSKAKAVPKWKVKPGAKLNGRAGKGRLGPKAKGKPGVKKKTTVKGISKGVGRAAVPMSSPSNTTNTDADDYKESLETSSESHYGSDYSDEGDYYEESSATPSGSDYTSEDRTNHYNESSTPVESHEDRRGQHEQHDHTGGDGGNASESIVCPEGKAGSVDDDYVEHIAVDCIFQAMDWAGASSGGRSPEALQGIFWMDQWGCSKDTLELPGFPWDKFTSETSKKASDDHTMTMERINPSAVVSFGDVQYSDQTIAAWDASTGCWGPLRAGRDRHWAFSDNYYGSHFASSFKNTSEDLYFCDLPEGRDQEDFIADKQTNPEDRDPNHRELMLKTDWGFQRKTVIMQDGEYKEGNYPLIQIADGYGEPTYAWSTFKYCALTVKDSSSGLSLEESNYLNADALGLILPFRDEG
jgi:hypothetical protein